MAKFAAQGGFRLPFSEKAGDLRESFQWRLGGGGAAGISLFGSQFDVHRRSRHRLARWSCRASSVGRRGRRFSEEEEERVTDDEDDEFEELERDELSCFRGLVLDISYRPVNVVCWRRAICLEFMEKADVLEYYDQTVSSPRGSFYIPAVLRVPHLLQVVKRRRVKYNLSRKSIFHRDSYTCQFKKLTRNGEDLCPMYEFPNILLLDIVFKASSWQQGAGQLPRYCCSRENLTIDHVIPISKGGEWKWENLVTACAKCNSRKGQKTLEQSNMKLFKVPKAPKDYDILAIPLTTAALKMMKLRKGVPEEWLQYLSQAAP